MDPKHGVAKRVEDHRPAAARLPALRRTGSAVRSPSAAPGAAKGVWRGVSKGVEHGYRPAVLRMATPETAVSLLQGWPPAERRMLGHGGP
jgi:hypothetical protein